MRIILLATLLTVSAAAGSAVPEKVDYHALSRTALNSGDLRSSALFLEKARNNAGENNSGLWRKLTVELAGVEITRGEVRRAGELLDQLAARFPDEDRIDRSILSARIMSANGNFEKAYDQLNNLLGGSSMSNEQLCSALNAMAEILMRAGRYGEAADVCDRIELVVNSEAHKCSALAGRIYALQLAGNTDESAAQIKRARNRYNTPEQQIYWDKAELFQLAVSGKIDEFQKKIAGLPAVEYDFMLCRALCKAAEVSKDRKLKLDFYRKALNCADRDSDRRNILRTIANILTENKRNAEAAELLKRYISYFADGDERIGILRQIGALLSGSGDYSKAYVWYDKLAADESLPPDVRIEAAENAALAAENASLSVDKVEKQFRYITGSSDNSGVRQKGFFMMGEYFLRHKMPGRAVEAFDNAVSEKGGLTGQAQFWLMRSYMELGNYSGAAKLAETLKNSGNQKLNSAGWYFSAMILEKSGDVSTAMSSYLAAAGKCKDPEYAALSIFDAARMGEKLKKYEQAAELYEKCAGNFAENPLAPNALCRAVYCAFLSGDDKLMDRSVSQLVSRYADSPYTAEALFLQADYMSAENRCQEAMTVLQKIVSLAKPGTSSALYARAVYNQAQLQVRLNNTGKALELINTVLDEYAGSGAGVAEDAALLAGNLYSNSGDYARAAGFYELALKGKRSDKRFSDICKERLADCQFSAYSANREKERLEQALRLYGELASEVDSGSAVPALFKLGRAQEQAKNPRAAVNAYTELLYRALHAGEKGADFEWVWADKAAYAAVTLLLQKGTPGGAQEALKILEIAGKLNLKSGDDLKKTMENIRRKYRL